MGSYNGRTVICIDDDDEEEVLVYSTTYTPSIAAVGPYTAPRSCASVVPYEDLELRLGLPGLNEAGVSNQNRRGESVATRAEVRTTIRIQEAVQVEGTKLTCTICLDTMKEETSTICGHLFCKSCISNAILWQNKCPTCRTKLTMRNIHRVYLPGTTTSSS